ncbi:MAG: SRPBCC family protein [Nocardioidaceae bacterium]|nr:SRPBCC family protein [Nocardioidaceae bacterium]
MSVTIREFQCQPEHVFDVLRDGWSYAAWVVGAARIREVDETWPAVGSRLQHSVGVWPMMLGDSTEVEAIDPPRLLQLRARAWPSGEARVRFELESTAGQCRVVITEKVVAGPARLIPNVLENALMHWRNTESLRRLAYLAERHSRR